MPIIALIVTFVALVAFFFYSQTIEPIPFGIFPRPPIYGSWHPTISSFAFLVIPAGLFFVSLG